MPVEGLQFSWSFVIPERLSMALVLSFKFSEELGLETYFESSFCLEGGYLLHTPLLLDLKACVLFKFKVVWFLPWPFRSFLGSFCLKVLIRIELLF